MEDSNPSDSINQFIQIARLAKHGWPTFTRLWQRWRSQSDASEGVFAEAVVEQLQANALDTIASQTLTMAQAFEIIGPDFDSGKVVDPTWQKRWLDGTSRIATEDEERRSWWARLLAGEMQQPGSFSLRTLSLMDTLSTTEARYFHRACQYVWIRVIPNSPMLFIPEKHRRDLMPVDMMLKLEESGLLLTHALGYNFTGVRTADTVLQNANLEIVFELAKGAKMKRGSSTLTRAGEELYTLVDMEADESYQQLVIDDLKGQGFEVHRAGYLGDQWIRGPLL